MMPEDWSDWADLCPYIVNGIKKIDNIFALHVYLNDNYNRDDEKN